jgi:hypothetical protein
MNPDEVMVKKIIDILEKDLNQLQQTLQQISKKNLDRNTLDEAYFLSQEIQMYLYKLFTFAT